MTRYKIDHNNVVAVLLTRASESAEKRCSNAQFFRILPRRNIYVSSNKSAAANSNNDLNTSMLYETAAHALINPGRTTFGVRSIVAIDQVQRTAARHTTLTSNYKQPATI